MSWVWCASPHLLELLSRLCSQRTFLPLALITFLNSALGIPQQDCNACGERVWGRTTREMIQEQCLLYYTWATAYLAVVHQLWWLNTVPRARQWTFILSESVSRKKHIKKTRADCGHVSSRVVTGYSSYFRSVFWLLRIRRSTMCLEAQCAR